MRSDQLYIYQEELHCSVGLGVDAHSEPVAVSRLVEEDQGQAEPLILPRTSTSM